MSVVHSRTLLALVWLVGCGSSSTEPDGSVAGADGGRARLDADVVVDGAQPAEDAGPAVACAAPDVREGDATYYASADGSGNCSFPATPGDLMVGAMNHTDYADSAACGACAQIEGPGGTIVVRIVDQCPECAPGDIDLSPDAFEQIAELSAGRVPIAWRYVPCDVRGPLAYHFKEGSNPFWTAVQVRNHRHAIARFEYLGAGGDFVEVARLDYNYFVEPEGMGAGPFTFRVTDVYGNVVTDPRVPLLDAAEAPGAGQFPPCE